MDSIGHSPSSADVAKTRQWLEIEAIAREVGRPIVEVAEIFAGVDAELRRSAKVTDFLSVLVARKVRARYR